MPVSGDNNLRGTTSTFNRYSGRSTHPKTKEVQGWSHSIKRRIGRFSPGTQTVPQPSLKPRLNLADARLSHQSFDPFSPGKPNLLKQATPNFCPSLALFWERGQGLLQKHLHLHTSKSACHFILRNFATVEV
jgi:hypothetical protein